MDKRDRKVLALYLSFAMAYMLLIYAPLELYFTNISEWWYDLYLLLPIIILLFIVALAASTLFLFGVDRFLPKAYAGIISFYFAVYLCLYIEGNYLAGGLPPLDGRDIVWKDYSTEQCKSLFLWLFVGVIVILAYKKVARNMLTRIIRYSCLFVTGMLTVTLIVLSVSSNGFCKKMNIGATSHDLLSMSGDTNFIILVLDCIDAGDFSRIIEEKPEYQKVFNDFTYYDNVVGSYGYTKHAIPFILSGDWYENDGEFDEYVVNACTQSTLISKLRQQKWDMGLYDNELLVQDEKFFQYDNVMYNQYGTVSYGTFILWEVELVCYKYAPFALKSLFLIDPAQFDSLIKPAKDEEIFCFADSNKRLYRDVLEKEIEIDDNSKFKFIHLDGAHASWDLDENVQISSRATYETEIEASIKITDAYLKKLKEAGVYDNTIMIIMSDHGYRQGDALHHQHPILLTKGLGEKHEFEISDIPISHVDLQDAYQKLLSGAIGKSVFDINVNNERERRYLFYDNDITDEIMYEYYQKGKAGDWETFVPTGKEYRLKE